MKNIYGRTVGEHCHGMDPLCRSEDAEVQGKEQGHLKMLFEQG